jgi:hypothetical protein
VRRELARRYERDTVLRRQKRCDGDKYIERALSTLFAIDDGQVLGTFRSAFPRLASDDHETNAVKTPPLALKLCGQYKPAEIVRYRKNFAVIHRNQRVRRGK